MTPGASPEVVRPAVLDRMAERIEDPAALLTIAAAGWRHSVARRLPSIEEQDT